MDGSLHTSSCTEQAMIPPSGGRRLLCLKKKKVLKNLRDMLNHKIRGENRAEWMYTVVEWTNNL